MLRLSTLTCFSICFFCFSLTSCKSLILTFCSVLSCSSFFSLVNIDGDNVSSSCSTEIVSSQYQPYLLSRSFSVDGFVGDGCRLEGSTGRLRRPVALVEWLGIIEGFIKILEFKFLLLFNIWMLCLLYNLSEICAEEGLLPPLKPDD